MRIALFAHSVLSDWNHGNAHFLRGVVTELVKRGHQVRCLEPRDGWSIRNLVEGHGEPTLAAVREVYPALDVERYDLERLDLDRILDGVDLVLVHDWNDPELVRRLGRRRARGGRFRLFFHDTHHRSITAPDEMARYALDAYDAVLAFGEAVREVYARRGWGRRAFTWHEAADARVFRPVVAERESGDLVWIGNWGDEERTEELHEFLLRPVEALGLRARVFGVRYPAEGVAALERAGLTYGGWLPNHEVPEVVAGYGVTVHVPRRPYARALPGIPTIRVFEALACGIPLVSAPWDDAEGLFCPGADFLLAKDGKQMQAHLHRVLSDPELARSLSHSGRERILSRHTCAHRVDELLGICRAIDVDRAGDTPARAGVGG